MTSDACIAQQLHELRYADCDIRLVTRLICFAGASNQVSDFKWNHAVINIQIRKNTICWSEQLLKNTKLSWEIKL